MPCPSSASLGLEPPISSAIPAPICYDSGAANLARDHTAQNGRSLRRWERREKMCRMPFLKYESPEPLQAGSLVSRSVLLRALAPILGLARLPVLALVLALVLVQMLLLVLVQVLLLLLGQPRKLMLLLVLALVRLLVLALVLALALALAVALVVVPAQGSELALEEWELMWCCHPLRSQQGGGRNRWRRGRRRRMTKSGAP